MAQQDPDKSTDHEAVHLPTPLARGDANSAAPAPPSPDEAIFASIEDAQPIGADDPPASREPDEPSDPGQEREPESFDLDGHQSHAQDRDGRADEASLHTPAHVASSPDLPAPAVDADSTAQAPLDQEPPNTDGVIFTAGEDVPPIVAGEAAVTNDVQENDDQWQDHRQTEDHLEVDRFEEDHAAEPHARGRDQESRDQESLDLGANEPREREPDRLDEPDQIQPDATGGAEGAPVEAAKLRAHELDLEPEPAAPEPPPAPRKRGFWRKFMLFLALLGLVATGGGLAAIQFKDKDERLRVISDFIEGAIKDPKVFFRSLEEKAANWLADAPPNSGQVAQQTPVKAKDIEQPTEPRRQPESPGWASAPVQIAPAQTADAGVKDARDAELARLADRIDRIEESAKAALKAAQDAKSAQTPVAPQPSPEEGKYLNALEGRIDELAEEIRAVRERLDAPKNETRLAPEPAETQKPAPGKMSGTAADIVVVAQSLIHELERGRPYAAEQAALSNLGADPELLAALAPSAESGAPTAAQLLKSFAPASRALRALGGPKTGSSLADQLMQEAGRLVKVRPAHEPAVETIFDIVGKIETALAHDDIGAAADAFARLPDNAKAEAKAFGETLNRRRDAEKAAASLLSGAIAALGRAKN
jgi:hypothetical protein